MARRRILEQDLSSMSNARLKRRAAGSWRTPDRAAWREALRRGLDLPILLYQLGDFVSMFHDFVAIGHREDATEDEKLVASRAAPLYDLCWKHYLEAPRPNNLIAQIIPRGLAERPVRRRKPATEAD